jgi:ammonia channel protein AmtB
MTSFQNYQRHRNWSSVCFCSGVVAGLITITPGSGYVCSRESAVKHLIQYIKSINCSEAALFFGVAGSIISYFAPELKKYGGYDDSLDVRYI